MVKSSLYLQHANLKTKHGKKNTNKQTNKQTNNNKQTATSSFPPPPPPVRQPPHKTHKTILVGHTHTPPPPLYSPPTAISRIAIPPLPRKPETILFPSFTLPRTQKKHTHTHTRTHPRVLDASSVSRPASPVWPGYWQQRQKRSWVCFSPSPQPPTPTHYIAADY